MLKSIKTFFTISSDQFDKYICSNDVIFKVFEVILSIINTSNYRQKRLGIILDIEISDKNIIWKQPLTHITYRKVLMNNCSMG